MLIKLIFLAHVAATLYMVGLIWLVQVVHYPLFGWVGPDGFVEYEAQHTSRISLVVIPPMLVEIGTAFLLLFLRPTAIPLWQVVVGIVLVLLVWFSTFFLQVPQHNILSQGFNTEAYRLLVTTNWLRTIAWSARGLLVVWMIAQVME
jgi:hypothetical protein